MSPAHPTCSAAECGCFPSANGGRQDAAASAIESSPELDSSMLLSLYSRKSTSSGTGGVLYKQAASVLRWVSEEQSCLQMGWGSSSGAHGPGAHTTALSVRPSWSCSPPFKPGPTHCSTGEHGEARCKNPFCFLSDAISFLAKMARLNTSFAHYNHF